MRGTTRIRTSSRRWWALWLAQIILSAATPTIAAALTVDEPSTPSVPLTVTRGREFEVRGYLKPAHADEQAPITLYCFRLERGSWTLKSATPATVTAAATYSSYAATVSLPATGAWRIRARHLGIDATSIWSAPSRTINVRTMADATIWNRDTITTIPEKMAYRGNARQMVIATARRLDSHYGSVRVYEYRNGDWIRTVSVPCRFGRNGLTNGATRRSGTRTTPTGIWVMPGYGFGLHPSAPSGTRLPYRAITPRSWWSAQNDSTYNTWVETTRTLRGEHLTDYWPEYEWAISTGYNSLPNRRIYDRGSAIFLHAFGPGLTSGCISISAADMVRVFRALDPNLRRVFAIGTTATGTRTSIYRY